MPFFDRCECLCHSRGSIIPWAAPEVSDPIAALTACERCAVLHAGVWIVVPRGNPLAQADGNTDSEGPE